MTENMFSKMAAKIFLCALLFSTTHVGADELNNVQWFQRDIGDGVTWNYYLFEDLYGSPQSVSYIEADLDNPNVEVVLPYLASSRDQTSDLIPDQFANAVGGINGTYFDTRAGFGGHETYLRVNSVDVPQGDTPTKGAWSYDSGLTIDASDNVTVAEVPTGGWTNDVSSTDIIANGPMLTNGGSIDSSYLSGIGSHCTSRNPRSAVGVTSGNNLIMLTVDGRTDSSAGMTCEELAQTMLDLGCDQSTNLDGGGSTTLWADGEPFSGVINYPSDNSNYDHLGERSVSNAIAVTSTAASTPTWDARLDSVTFNNLTRSGENFPVTATYTNLGTETWTTSNLSVMTSRAFGRSSDFIPSGQELTFYSMSPSTVATGETATITLNLESPDVVSDTNYQETFALSSTAVGYFGPADNELGFSVTVRPELTGAPPTMIVQGGSNGINNQWYEEPVGSWGNSSVSFSAPGVTNDGTQRFVGAASTGRSARFSPIFDVAGMYRVEVAFPSSTNNIEVQYAVNHAGGTSTFDIDQHPTGGLNNQWVELGEFEFTTGESGGLGIHNITVSNPTDTGNRFYSGAVRIDYVGSSMASIIGNKWTVD